MMDLEDFFEKAFENRAEVEEFADPFGFWARSQILVCAPFQAVTQLSLGDAESSFFAELFMRGVSGVHYDFALDEEGLLRAKMIAAFVEFGLAPDARARSVEKARFNKYAVLAGDACGEPAKYRFLVKQIEPLRNIMQVSLDRGGLQTAVTAYPDRHVPALCETLYAHLLSEDNLFAQALTEEQGVELRDWYLNGLEARVKDSYRKVVQEEPCDLEVEFLCEMTARFEAGWPFFVPEGEGPVEQWRSRAMRGIVDCIYYVDDGYRYDRHALISALECAQCASDEPSTYQRLLERSKVFELVAADLLCDEVQVRAVKERLDGQWLEENLGSLERFAKERSYPTDEGQLDMLVDVVRFSKRVFGADINEELLYFQERHGVVDGEDYVDAFDFVERAEYLELQVIDLFCSAIEQERGFCAGEIRFIEGALARADGIYASEQDREGVYAFLASNLDESLALAREYARTASLFLD